MLNQDTLNQWLNWYSASLATTRPDELFKWQAVKHFQDTWDLEAADFGNMLLDAFSKAEFLLVGPMWYPYKMLYEIAKRDSEVMREWFRSLFDETRDLTERIEEFSARAEEYFHSVRGRIVIQPITIQSAKSPAQIPITIF